ncbi:DUF247 domain protein [Medicago truncatula]|nr:DUF247 domain protein [Medicago truncatula]
MSSLVDINAMLDSAEPPPTKDRCIYKVPSVIRTVNENAYTPNVVSIGPFHHGHLGLHLQNMERQKLIHFKAFLQRTEASLNDLVCYVDSILSDFKHCYSEPLPFSHNELVKLILIDSAFIIQLFWRKYYGGALFQPWLKSLILYDVLLLENQLPFFVIEKIYSRSCSIYKSVPSFLELTIHYFKKLNKSKLSFDNGDISIRHFTDLIRIFHLQHPIESRPSRVKIEKRIIHIQTATQLVEAGVRFQVKTKSKCLYDLRFSGGVLEIPQLIVHDRTTEILFRNMIALEHCHYPHESYILDYVLVLDYLINNGKDVDVLIQKQILENLLGDGQSMAILFNGLCKNVVKSKLSYHFVSLSNELDAFCNNPRNKLKATLRRDYGNTPWKIAASVAGVLLLVLTIIQTVCSVLQIVQAS